MDWCNKRLMDVILLLLCVFLCTSCPLPYSKSLSLLLSALVPPPPPHPFSIHSPHPFSIHFPPFTWRSYSSFLRLTRRSALALCNPANPISLATRTKELNDTVPSQEREREGGGGTTQIPQNTWPLNQYLYVLPLFQHSLLYHSAFPSPSPGAQNGLEMASMG